MKRIFLALLFVALLAVPAWAAARTLYPVQAPASMNWSAATWALTDGGTADEVKPAAGDTVYFTANSGDVTVDENTNALAEFNMNPVTTYAGTLALGSYTLTVDGPCELCGTITGTGTIDAGEGTFEQRATVADAITLLLTTSGSHNIYWTGSGGSININCAGTWTLQNNISAYAFTQTLGTFDPNEIATPLTLNGEGCALTYVGGTVTNAPAEFDVIFAANGQSSWPSWTSRLHKLTVNEGATLTLAGDTKLINFVLDGTLALNAQTLSFYLAGNDWWTQTGSVGGNGTVIFYASADGCSNAGAIDVGSGELRVAATAAARTLTFSDNITCGILQAGEGSGGGTITAIVNGALTASSVVFGKAAVADCAGVLTLASSQVHRVTGAIARHATNTSEAHAFNPQGRVILGGTFTGTGITVTPTSEGMIDAGGFGRVTAVTSTGRRLVVRRAVNAAGMPLRSFNADGCTNVMFRGRKVIGNPGVN